MEPMKYQEGTTFRVMVRDPRIISPPELVVEFDKIESALEFLENIDKDAHLVYYITLSKPAYREDKK